MGALSFLVTLLVIILGIVSKKSKLVVYSLLLLLFTLITFEYTKDGDGDYYIYNNIYNSIGEGYEWALIGYEPLFVLFFKICYNTGLSLVATKGVMALFVLSLFYSTIKLYTRNTALVLSLLFIYPALFDAELMRWIMAESIVIYGIRYLIRANGIRDYVYYILLVLLAALFHVSTLIFLFFLFASIKKKKNLFVLIMGISTVMIIAKSFTPLYSFLNALPLSDHLQDKYQTDYLGNSNALIMSVFRYLQAASIFFVPYYLTIRKKKHVKNKIGFNDVDSIPNKFDDFFEKIAIMNIVMILFIPFNLFSAQVERYYHIMVIINYICFSVIYEMGRENKSFQLLYIILVSLSLLWFGSHFSEGAMLVFESHFSIGYLTRMFNILFAL